MAVGIVDCRVVNCWRRLIFTYNGHLQRVCIHCFYFYSLDLFLIFICINPFQMHLTVKLYDV